MYILLVYYQDGCGYCEKVMQELQSYYYIITSRRIKIVSLLADTDELVFKCTSNSYLWKDKYYDSKEIIGDNFNNYGIMSTPPFIL